MEEKVKLIGKTRNIKKTQEEERKVMRSSGKAEGGKVRREGKRRREGMIGEKER